MSLTPELVAGLNTVLNEATLLAVEVDTEERVAAVELVVLTLPEDDDRAADRRVQLVLRGLGRVAASWRHGHWNDASAPVEPFEIEGLQAVVRKLGGNAIYGWKFVDVPDPEDFVKWRDRLSLNWHAAADGGTAHTLTLFQELPGEHLDLRLWFDELAIYALRHEELSTAEFAAGGRRWWNAFRGGDPRTQGEGMVPLS